MTVQGRSGSIWRETFALFGQSASDSDITQLVTDVQEEEVVVSRGLLQPTAQRSRKAIRGTEVRDETGQKATGCHVGSYRRPSK